MNKKIIAPALVAGVTLISGSAAAQSRDSSFAKSVYLGVGGGQSKLRPDTSAVPNLSVIDDKDTAANVTVGLDFSRRLSAELQYVDLGTSGLSDGDGIEYSEVSVSGIYYMWNGFGSSDYLDYDGLDQRRGLSLYGRLGLGKMENTAVRDVLFERENDAQLMVGLGVEYGLGFGLGIRAEYTNFDTDAKYQGLSLLYRFGGRRVSSEPVLQEEPELDLPVLPAPEPLETLPPAPPPPPDFVPEGQELPPIPAVTADDSDGDGVGNSLDECTDTTPGTPVGSNGCAMFNGTLEGVNFLTGSDTLTDEARFALDDVVATMNAFPDVRVSVQAHTDSQGLEAANMDLSRKRALSVVRYLTAQGIPVDRLEARAYGESQPIADNTTRAGRLMNRRVEFRVIQ